MTQESSNLKFFLEPRSIALVGVSRQAGDGTNLLENLISYGFTGKIFPVNSKASEILGMKVYASVADIPEEVDLAVILTPRSSVPSLHPPLCPALGRHGRGATSPDRERSHDL